MVSTVRRRATLALALVAVLAAGPAAAQTLYKLIDKNGKVTYTQEPPKNFDGQVIRIDVDPNANTATLPKYEPPKAAAEEPKKPLKKGAQVPMSAEQKVAAAKDELEKRKAALKYAQEHPGEGDVQLMGNVGKGTRMQPTEAYQKRLDELERAVKEAEDAVRDAERL